MAMAVAVVLALPGLAQRQDEHRDEPQRHDEARGQEQHPAEPARNAPRGNQGRIPEAPAPRPANARPEPDTRGPGRVNNTPHVANDHWYGHDRPNDPHYRVAHPFEHGHFEHVGPSYRYNVLRIDMNQHRFWLPGGFFFDVAPNDWALAADWCWSCGEDFVVYDDPDHPGWYMVYNIHTGGYVHAMYMGS
jgi:hypothetical protein